MNVGRFQLTYCSNIHAGESWSEVERNLITYLPQVRRNLKHAGPFGIGLRLSDAAARSLEAPESLARFQSFLNENDFYVFTINGFPFGAFHGTRVKEAVYLPDWRDPRRLEYSNRLGGLLATLLPAGMEGCVSTVPGAYKPAMQSPEDRRVIAENLRKHATFLKDLEARTGKRVTLAIEPEPCCVMETIDETIAFFSDDLRADEDLLQRIGVCFDACHMAVEFEDPADAFRRLAAAGIRIFKFQISSAVQYRFHDGAAARTAFEPFAEDTYLHQVVENDHGRLSRHVDLPDAFDHISRDAMWEREWRVHFHVPIFLSELAGGLSTSQSYLSGLFRLLKASPVCTHLEVETYTWDVLPETYRNVDIATAIARELDWVRNQLNDD